MLGKMPRVPDKRKRPGRELRQQPLAQDNAQCGLRRSKAQRVLPRVLICEPRTTPVFRLPYAKSIGSLPA